MLLVILMQVFWERSWGKRADEKVLGRTAWGEVEREHTARSMQMFACEGSGKA